MQDPVAQTLALSSPSRPSAVVNAAAIPAPPPPLPPDPPPSPPVRRWITWWTQQKYDLSNSAYNFIYLLGAMGFSFFTFTNGIFWAQVGMLTAKNIHAELLKSVLAGRMEFFDTTPVIDPVLGTCPSAYESDRLSVYTC